MCQKEDCDKPPDEISAGIPMQRWDLCQAQRVVMNMGLYVALVLSQVEFDAGHNGGNVINLGTQGVECIDQPGHGVQIGLPQAQNTRAAFGQHLANPFTLLVFPLSRLRHPGPEVLRIKHHAIKQEFRCDIAAAFSALIPPDLERGDAATGKTPLKCHGGIEFLFAANAPAHALRYDGQATTASRAVTPDQHHAIEELAGLCLKGVHPFRQLTG